MVENLSFHVVLEGCKPGNGLIIHRIMKANKFCIICPFNLANAQKMDSKLVSSQVQYHKGNTDK